MKTQLKLCHCNINVHDYMNQMLFMIVGINKDSCTWLCMNKDYFTPTELHYVPFSLNELRTKRSVVQGTNAFGSVQLCRVHPLRFRNNRTLNFCDFFLEGDEILPKRTLLLHHYVRQCLKIIIFHHLKSVIDLSHGHTVIDED